jgi:ABC-2 type transport system permease protein
LAILRGFSTVLVKELKKLMRNPKILVGMVVLPLIVFPALGLVLGYAQQTAVEQAQRAQLLVLNNDGEEWSQEFISYLKSATPVTVLDNTAPQQVVDQGLLTQHNTTTFIEIPQGFSANMTVHLSGDPNIKATINAYGVYGGSSIFSGMGSTVAISLVNGFNHAIAPNVVYATQSTIIKGEIQTGIDPSVPSALMLSQAGALPITIMLLLTYAMQIAAISVAMEKEEKTLETLLTVPVDRFAILMGKLSSTIIVTGLAALAIMVGYNYMLGALTGAIEAGAVIDLVKLGGVPSLVGYTLLGISLFVTLLSGLALSVIMSAFAKDVRGATVLVGYSYPLIFIPAMALMYLDINALPLAIRTVFYTIPYSNPIIASKAIVLGDYTIVLSGIIYVTAFTVGIMYVASRLFATEKILTAKLKLKGLTGRKKYRTEEH